jgi:DNA-binding NarL/FixJ family response regulator
MSALIYSSQWEQWHIFTNQVTHWQEVLLPSHTILTPKELLIMNLIHKGDMDKEIAYKLNITISTLNSHKKNIMNKLNLHSKVQLALYTI